MYNWGNPLWHILYIIALNLPENLSNIEKRLLNMFLRNIRPILPCMKCQEHYSLFIKTNIPEFSTKSEAIDWVYKLDMSIKNLLGKDNIDKTIRINSMGDKIDKKRVSLLLCDLRTYFYMNSIKAKSIYIFLIYLTILLPDSEIRTSLKDIINVDNFNKEVFENCIRLFS